MLRTLDSWYDLAMTRVFDRLRSPLLLVLRLIFGWGLFQTGKGKLEDIDRFIDFLAHLHIPMPHASAYLSSVAGEVTPGMPAITGSRLPCARRSRSQVTYGAPARANWLTIRSSIDDDAAKAFFSASASYTAWGAMSGLPSGCPATPARTMPWRSSRPERRTSIELVYSPAGRFRPPATTSTSSTAARSTRRPVLRAGWPSRPVPIHVRKLVGTGLGLGIARQVVQMHGGRLWVVRTPEGDSEYHFTLPVQWRDRSVAAVANATATVTAAQAAMDVLQAQKVEAQKVKGELQTVLDKANRDLSFTTIRAPFDGVVTARYVDPGTLIPQSTTPSAAGSPIVSLATLAPLRVYAYAPQRLSPFIKDGAPATISVSELPGRRFSGTITRHPEALDQSTRTMLVEVDLRNADRSLYPGMYADLGMTAHVTANSISAPDDALIFRNDKVYLPVVRDHRLTLITVNLGHDNGYTVEVSGDGLHAGDLVAMNVGEAAHNGEPVQAVEAGQPTM